MKNKNKAYKERQRKAAAIKAGIKVGPEPTDKYENDTPDYIIKDLMRQGLSREEALQFAQDILKIRTISVEYGDDVCCQMCGRKNYPESKDGKKLEWSARLLL